MRRENVFSFLKFLSIAFLFLSSSWTNAQRKITGVPGRETKRAVSNFMELVRQSKGISKSRKVKNKPFMIIRRKSRLTREQRIKMKERYNYSPQRSPYNSFAASPSPSVSFQGLDDNNTSIPPDTHGSVGPSHLMVTLNTQVRMQDKTGTNLGTVTLETFWTGVVPNNAFDPKSVYDHLAKRFVFVTIADSAATTSGVMIAVSETSDPTGNWYKFYIKGDATNTLWVDYPSIGYNKDWIVVQVNMFTIAANAYTRSNIYVFKKSDLYNNVAATHTLIQDTDGSFCQVPAVTMDANLDVIYLLETGDPGAGTFTLSKISGAIGAETLSDVATVTSPNTGEFNSTVNFAPQSGSATGIMTNDARVQNLVYFNGKLWTTHTLFVPAGGATRSSIQWMELNTDGSIVQSGMIDDSTGKYFYAFPSIAVNYAESVLIGYSRFSSDSFASACYRFRYSTDTQGTLRDEVVFKAGVDTYIKGDGGGRVRWGDFSATALDPDTATMWTLQEYAEIDVGENQADDRWGTWWVSIQTGTPSPTPTTDKKLIEIDGDKGGCGLSQTKSSDILPFFFPYFLLLVCLLFLKKRHKLICNS